MSLSFETERLFIRPLQADDVDIEIELWTDPDVVEYVDDEVSSEEDIRGLMPAIIQRPTEGYPSIWCLVEKESGEKLGHIALLPMPIEEDDHDWGLLAKGVEPGDPIEIGFILKKSAWGKGFATESCKRLLQFVFEETPLKEIWASTDPENHASQNALVKCGIQPIGMIRAFAEDVPGFKITREQWFSQNPKSL